MPYSVPTVRVKSDHPEHDGYLVINASDFDPTKHERVAEPVAPPPGPPVPPPPPGPVSPLDGLSANWKEQSSSDLRKLAFAVTGGRAVENKDQAIAEIEKALAARG